MQLLKYIFKHAFDSANTQNCPINYVISKSNQNSI